MLAAAARPGLFRVGFAAEAGPRLDRARAKKAAKGVDLVVFNDILAEGVGIGSDENEITILTSGGEVHVPRTSKTACAAAIADHIEAGLRGMSACHGPSSPRSRRGSRARTCGVTCSPPRPSCARSLVGSARTRTSAASAGLAHDMDSEETEHDAARHGTLAAEALRSFGLSDEAVHAVAAHNPETGVVACGRIDVALIAADQLSGLVTAAALARPTRISPASRSSRCASGIAKARSREGWTARPSPGAPSSASSSTTSSPSGWRRCRASPPSSASSSTSVDSPERPAPEFCAESEAYTLFRRGVDFLDDGHPAQAAMYLAMALRLEPGRNSIRETLGRAEFAAWTVRARRGAVRGDRRRRPRQRLRALCARALPAPAGARGGGAGPLRLARALHPASETYRRRLDGVD